MDKMDWAMKWSAPLLPDLDCVPGDDVFLVSTQYNARAANSARVLPDVPFPSPADLPQSPHQGHKKKSRRKKKP